MAGTSCNLGLCLAAPPPVQATPGLPTGSRWQVVALLPESAALWGTSGTDLWLFRRSTYGVDAYHLDASTWGPDGLPADTSVGAMIGFGPTDVWGMGWKSTPPDIGGELLRWVARLT